MWHQKWAVLVPLKGLTVPLSHFLLGFFWSISGLHPAQVNENTLSLQFHIFWVTLLDPYVLIPGAMADKPEPRLYEAMMTINKFFDEHAKQEGDKRTMEVKEFKNMLCKDGDEVSKTYSQYCFIRKLEMLLETWKVSNDIKIGCGACFYALLVLWCLVRAAPFFSSWRGVQPFTLRSSRGSAGALGVPTPAVLERPHGAILSLRGRGWRGQFPNHYWHRKYMAPGLLICCSTWIMPEFILKNVVYSLVLYSLLSYFLHNAFFDWFNSGEGL